MFEGGGALGPIMDMAKSMFNMPIDSQMINEKLGLNFTTIIIRILTEEEYYRFYKNTTINIRIFHTYLGSEPDGHLSYKQGVRC